MMFYNDIEAINKKIKELEAERARIDRLIRNLTRRKNDIVYDGYPKVYRAKTNIFERIHD